MLTKYKKAQDGNPFYLQESMFLLKKILVLLVLVTSIANSTFAAPPPTKRQKMPYASLSASMKPQPNETSENRDLAGIGIEDSRGPVTAIPTAASRQANYGHQAADVSLGIVLPSELTPSSYTLSFRNVPIFFRQTEAARILASMSDSVQWQVPGFRRPQVEKRLTPKPRVIPVPIPLRSKYLTATKVAPATRSISIAPQVIGSYSNTRTMDSSSSSVHKTALVVATNPTQQQAPDFLKPQEEKNLTLKPRVVPVATPLRLKSPTATKLAPSMEPFSLAPQVISIHPHPKVIDSSPSSAPETAPVEAAKPTQLAARQTIPLNELNSLEQFALEYQSRKATLQLDFDGWATVLKNHEIAFNWLHNVIHNALISRGLIEKHPLSFKLVFLNESAPDTKKLLAIVIGSLVCEREQENKELPAIREMLEKAKMESNGVNRLMLQGVLSKSYQKKIQDPNVCKQLSALCQLEYIMQSLDNANPSTEEQLTSLDCYQKGIELMNKTITSKAREPLLLMLVGYPYTFKFAFARGDFAEKQQFSTQLLQLLANERIDPQPELEPVFTTLTKFANGEVR